MSGTRVTLALHTRSSSWPLKLSTMNMVLRKILNKYFIISVFLNIYLLGILWLVFTGKSTHLEYMSYKQLLMAKLVSFGVYLSLAYLSLKNIKIVTWILAVLIVLSGTGATLLGVFRIDWSQFLMKPSFIVFGLYFVVGGASLIFQPVTNRKKF